MKTASQRSTFQFVTAIPPKQMLPIDVAIMLPKSTSDVAKSSYDVAKLPGRMATCRGAVKYAQRILSHLSLFLSLNRTEMATWCPRLPVATIESTPLRFTSSPEHRSPSRLNSLCRLPSSRSRCQNPVADILLIRPCVFFECFLAALDVQAPSYCQARSITYASGIPGNPV